MSREQFEAVFAISRQTKKALIEAGVDSAFSAEIEQAIERKAGSFLPPVSGVFQTQLGNAGVNN